MKFVGPRDSRLRRSAPREGGAAKGSEATKWLQLETSSGRLPFIRVHDNAVVIHGASPKSVPSSLTRLFAVSILCAAPMAALAQVAPDSFKVYFQTGSASVAGDQTRTPDQAARLFRDGNPIVMIVAGSTDTVGAPARNLRLSITRAQAVAEGLAARGIPIGRLQVMGRGASELAMTTPKGVPSQDNRVVEITWR
jgi:outer membrane protein OmpA-like peptidoglycan-associated protein